MNGLQTIYCKKVALMSFHNFKFAKVILVASAFALMLPGLSSAQDFCITVGASSYVLVGKGFTVPGAGTCKPWTGFNSQGNSNAPSAGTACTSSNAKIMALTITTTFPDFTNFFLDSIKLPFPSKIGTDLNVKLAPTGNIVSNVSAVGVRCTTQAIPANGSEESASPDSEMGPGETP
jgi:hypothetical protein